MSTVYEIETAFAEYLAAIVPGRQLVQGRAGEDPAPAGPCVVWSLEDFEPPDSTRTEFLGDDQTVRAVTPMTFRVICLGGLNTRDDAWRIAGGLRLTQRTGDLYRVCGLWGVSPIQDLTALETGTMRQRAEFTVTLSANLSLAAPRESIDQVDIRTTEPLKAFDKTITIQGPT